MINVLKRKFNSLWHILYIKKIKATNPDNWKRLRALENTHQNKRCFIIGNGPSLTATDLDQLTNEITFAANRIFPIFNKTKWRPTYYSASDIGVLEEILDEVNALNCKEKFLTTNYLAIKRKKIAVFRNALVFDELLPKSRSYHKPDFSEDICRGASLGWTITYINIQIAIYMGFKKIFLIGCDQNYPRIFDENGNIVQTEMKLGYFDESCLTPSQSNQVVNLKYTEAAFKKAREYADAHGIEIFNATRGGNLEVFKRIDFDNIKF